ncbi:MAG TPA: protein kinase [Gemmatimonadales bacterium]|nr:protein kinase [Gemmatimonadales bacterium]
MPADLLAHLRTHLDERYAIERELGRGGMSTVFLAHDRKHGRPVALKVFRPQVAEVLGVARFVREVQLAARLTHPHIVPLHDSGEVGGVPYFVMPYVEGETLRERLDREHRLAVAEVVRLGREMADALDYAHRQGVVHRDVKPENILLAGAHVLVLDFGVARAAGISTGELVTQSGYPVGTPMYMSPEQAAGLPEVDGRSDVYSLGCVLFEAIAGRPPFSGPTAQAILIRRLSELPPLLRTVRPSVPAGVEEAVARALARAPADRFATAVGFAEALSAGGSAGARVAGGADPPGAAPTLPDASIAVLPFANMSAEPDNEHFSDGMAEALIGALAKVPGLRVASRSSTFAWKGRLDDVRAIGERLKVRSVLEGSVRKAAGRLRIAAQLVDVADGYQLWSETYDRELADVFALQDEIARTLVARLAPQLVRRAAGPLVEAPTEIVEAYSLYLRGRYLCTRRTVESYQMAIRYFEDAIAADPGFAKAYTGVAHAYCMLSFDEIGAMRPVDAMPRARAALARAVELDPMLGEAHSRQAMLSMLYDWDWERAGREFEQALERNPGDPAALHWYSLYLSILERHEESLRVITRALTLEPMSTYIHVQLGRTYYYARRFDEAMRELVSVVEMEPEVIGNVIQLARVRLMRGEAAEAAALAERSMARLGRRPILVSFAGMAYGEAGCRDRAQACLAELELEAARRHVPAMYFVQVLSALGELDSMFHQLERARAERAGWLAFSRVDPRWDAVRGDPRFVAHVRAIGPTPMPKAMS